MYLICDDGYCEPSRRAWNRAKSAENVHGDLTGWYGPDGTGRMVRTIDIVDIVMGS
jgi:hypothetical protein